MIHHVFANRSNVGDWLSAQGIRKLLPPVPVTEHLCDAPFVSETLARLAVAGPNDQILIGGGGLFSDYFRPFWEGFAALASRVPYAIWGVGCCDRKAHPSLLPLDLMEPIITGSRLCVVRDDLTRRVFARCDLPPPVPCPTLNAVEAAPVRGRGLLHVDHYDNIGEEAFERITRMTEAFALRTGRSCRQTNNLIPAGQAHKLADVVRLYQNADLVVSSRLHGLILGLATGSQLLAISGDRKVESFMEAAGLGDWVCDLHDLDTLPDRMEALPAQPPAHEFLEKARRDNGKVALALVRRFGLGTEPTS